MPKYIVTGWVTTEEGISLEVEAENEDEAIEKAYDLAETQYLEAAGIDLDEIEEVEGDSN